MRCGPYELAFGARTLVMGILNVTPDSFSDGGRYTTVEAAVRRAMEMVADGADIIDVGGESTRPGAAPVPASEELKRVVPVIRALRDQVPVPISIDTYKAEVARAALEAGAHIVNDVWGLQGDPAMARVVAEAGVPVVVMHGMARHVGREEPARGGDLMGGIKGFLSRSVAIAEAAGLPRDQVIVDPGFGFGKDVAQNLEMVARLGELRDLGCPILLGPSRKSTIGKVLDLPVDERLEGTAAVVALAVAQKVDIVRVHDVRAMVRVVRMADAVARTIPGLAVTAYLGLGSNLGDREDNLRAAVERLDRRPGIRIRRLSALYETEPVGLTAQPLFLNQVAEAEVALGPHQLLEEVMAVERELGRERGERWGPRVIDIDILLYGEAAIDRPGLAIPHPQLPERAFALVPLVELAPHLVLPDGRRVAELAARAAGPGTPRVWRHGAGTGG